MLKEVKKEEYPTIKNELIKQLELINSILNLYFKENYFILYHYIYVDLYKNEITIPVIIKSFKKYNFLIIKSDETNINKPTYSYVFDIILGELEGANVLKNDDGNNINLFILLPSKINFNINEDKKYNKIKIDKIIQLLNYELETNNNTLVLSKDLIITNIIPLFENKNQDLTKLDLFIYYKPHFFVSLENKIDIFFKNPTYIIQDKNLIKINHITNDYHKSLNEGSIFIEKLKTIYNII